MTLIRRRYYIWLTKAYLKKWKKTIFTSLMLGGVAFFAFLFSLNIYILPHLENKVQKIGYFGTYTLQTLPNKVLDEISYGLTKIEPNGTTKPAAAFKWEIKNDGKEYIFFLRKGQVLHNNKPLNSKNVNLNFKDVEKKIIDDYTISYTLKNPYSPFLVTVSKPIFNGNFVGLGEFELKKVELNSEFVKMMILENARNSSYKKYIYFYPTQDALKTAYALGEVDKIIGVTDTAIQNTQFKNWKNTSIEEYTDYSELTTVFYNNSDATLSNKKARQALNYALPNKLGSGERAYSPISPKSVYFSKSPNYGIFDIEIAKSLLSSAKELTEKDIEISTTEEYKTVAQDIKKAWGKIGVKSKIKIVMEIPRNFQVLIYPIKLPIDPDQYTLWHSDQVNNIIKYKNLRIDKLLEDGRSAVDFEKRLSIYSDFQKYLIDDVPASFLYFPKRFIVSRK